MARLEEATLANRQALAWLPGSVVTEALQEIHDILWPPKDPTAVDWDSTTADAIAKVLQRLTDDAQGNAAEELDWLLASHGERLDRLGLDRAATPAATRDAGKDGGGSRG